MEQVGLVLSEKLSMADKLLPCLKLLLIILLHSSQLSTSWAQFVFDFQLHAVTTNGDCNSVLEVFDPECETYLNRFCLRERGYSRSTDDSDCPLGSSGRFGPGGNLPISRQILSSQSWAGGFQMFMRAYDEDIDFDDHLDNIFIDMELNESNTFTAVREFTGDMNKVSVNMAFRVRMCPENFYGANCDILCLAQDDDVNGHYICNGDGSFQCLPGFENTTNNCRDVVNPCDPTPCANNGNCTSMGPFNYTCQCAPGYTGSACEDVIDGCLEITCPNNSVCVNGSLCVCLPGFELTGGVCALPETPSSADDPAVNTGSQVGDHVIIGSAVGGAVVLILVVLIVIVVMTFLMFANRKRPQSLEKLSEDRSSPEHSKQTLKLELSKRSALQKMDSMDGNPNYGIASPVDTPQPQQQQNGSIPDSTTTRISTTENSDVPISVAPNPIYGIDTSPCRPQRSTIRHVQNPVYGDPSDKSTNEHVYSSPNQLQTLSSDGDSGEPDTYRYATIKETAMDYTTTKATLQKNGTSQSTQELLENEYAVVDMSTDTSNFASPYDQLKREQNSDKHSCQSQAQRTVRLSENKDLGYSTLT